MALIEPVSSAGHSSALLWLLALVVGLAVLIVRNRLTYRVDPQEPPVIQPTVPIVGHTMGLLRSGHEYLHRLMQVYKL
jgi:hypothetical protein